MKNAEYSVAGEALLYSVLRLASKKLLVLFDVGTWWGTSGPDANSHPQTKQHPGEWWVMLRADGWKRVRRVQLTLLKRVNVCCCVSEIREIMGHAVAWLYYTLVQQKRSYRNLALFHALSGFRLYFVKTFPRTYAVLMLQTTLTIWALTCDASYTSVRSVFNLSLAISVHLVLHDNSNLAQHWSSHGHRSDLICRWLLQSKTSSLLSSLFLSHGPHPPSLFLATLPLSLHRSFPLTFHLILRENSAS